MSLHVPTPRGAKRRPIRDPLQDAHGDIMPNFRERPGQQHLERGPAQADGRTRISVKRGNVAQDGFDKLTGTDLKTPVEIMFIDQFGQESVLPHLPSHFPVYWHGFHTD